MRANRLCYRRLVELEYEGMIFGYIFRVHSSVPLVPQPQNRTKVSDDFAKLDRSHTPRKSEHYPYTNQLSKLTFEV
jgi:hypothetical protein